MRRERKGARKMPYSFASDWMWQIKEISKENSKVPSPGDWKNGNRESGQVVFGKKFRLRNMYTAKQISAGHHTWVPRVSAKNSLFS